MKNKKLLVLTQLKNCTQLSTRKKPKGSELKDEEETPPIPPHTVEELYIAVEKRPKSSVDENKEAPSQTILQNTAEDLYTAVIKKPKDGSTEVAPHTVEELYTLSRKSLKKVQRKKRKAHQYLFIQWKKINSLLERSLTTVSCCFST